MRPLFFASPGWKPARQPGWGSNGGRPLRAGPVPPSYRKASKHDPVQEGREVLMRRSLVTLVLILAAGSTSSAQDWAKAMFDHTKHDFGVVARGQKVQHSFPVENIYLEDMRIESVKTTCTCTKPKITEPLLKKYEKGEIVAVVDTRKYLGRRDATLTVKVSAQLDSGALPAYVQLHCYVYIRRDVVLEPGTVRFSQVDQGTDLPRQKVAISHAGKQGWEIVRAESDNPHLDLELVETGRQLDRTTQVEKVSYDLFVGLKAGAPVGRFRDHVILVTNDRKENATRVVVSVEGDVVSTVSARPSSLSLAVPRPGQTVERILVVQAKEAFRIVDVTGPDDRFQFAHTDEAKTLHVLRVIFTAGDTPGKITGTIRIKTDVAGSEELEVKFHGQVVEPCS